jgi:hypothetical protein
MCVAISQQQQQQQGQRQGQGTNPSSLFDEDLESQLFSTTGRHLVLRNKGLSHSGQDRELDGI